MKSTQTRKASRQAYFRYVVDLVDKQANTKSLRRLIKSKNVTPLALHHWWEVGRPTGTLRTWQRSSVSSSARFSCRRMLQTYLTWVRVLILPCQTSLFPSQESWSLKRSPCKVTGLDNIPARLLKTKAEEITPALTLLPNKHQWDPSSLIASLCQSCIQEGWSDAANYRPISLTSVCVKLLEHVVTVISRHPLQQTSYFKWCSTWVQKEQIPWDPAHSDSWQSGKRTGQRRPNEHHPAGLCQGLQHSTSPVPPTEASPSQHPGLHLPVD